MTIHKDINTISSSRRSSFGSLVRGIGVPNRLRAGHIYLARDPSDLTHIFHMHTDSMYVQICLERMVEKNRNDSVKSDAPKVAG